MDAVAGAGDGGPWRAWEGIEACGSALERLGTFGAAWGTLGPNSECIDVYAFAIDCLCVSCNVCPRVLPGPGCASTVKINRCAPTLLFTKDGAAWCGRVGGCAPNCIMLRWMV
eukprot:4142140-Pyramimonas_sp.AAC.1